MRDSLLESLSLFRRRVAIDLREEGLYWAESSWGAKGRRLRRWGCIDRGDGEVPDQLVQQLAGTPLIRGAEVVIPLQHPELRIRRLDLPPLHAREARRVVSRRVRELGDEIGEGANCGFARSRRKGAGPVWLVASPQQFCEFEEQRWKSLGLPVHRLASLHLALGNLSRVLPRPEARELVAVFDMSAHHGTCVLLDAEGWVFGRDVPLKFAGDHLLHSIPGGELELDPLERGLDQAARLTNELHRTFHYAETELHLGTVTRLVLSGESEDLLSLRSLLLEKLGIEVLLLGDAIPEGPGAGAHPAAAVALGLALGLDQGGENLLPVPARRALARKRARQHLTASAALTGALLLSAASYLGSTLSALQEEIASFDATWESRAAVRRRAETAASARARGGRIEEVIGSIWRPVPSWTGALEALGLSLPDDALVERLIIDHEGTRWNATLHLEFRGEDVAEAAQSISRFTTDLGESPLWVVRSLEREPLPPGLSEEDSGSRMRFRVVAEVAPVSPATPAAGEGGPSGPGDSHG